MPDGFTGQVILGWPANRADVDRINQDVPPSQRFTPTVEHSLSTCDHCTRSIWIGPTQRQLVDSVFVAARKLCMFCASDVQRVLGLNPQQVDLNLDVRQAPHRT